MKQPNDTPENPRMPLTRRNYILLAAGFGIILLGFVLMAGGGSGSPDPILVIGGFAVEAYAILKRWK